MTDQTHPSGGDASYHEPVLVDEVVDWLGVEAGGRYVDGTVGGGGHTDAVLKASCPDGRVLGIDRDPEAIEEATARLAAYGDRVSLVRGNYAEAGTICKDRQYDPVDGFLVDAGLSSHQVDSPERGFSIQEEGPLDMRMGPEAERADQFIDRVTEHRLAEVLRKYGDLAESGELADAIKTAREGDDLETTADLAEVVRAANVWTRSGLDPATLVFQALRIAVNDELEHLRTAVQRIPTFVRPGGRAVFISFQSLEDRIVKHGFRELANDCVCPPDLPVCGCDERAEVEILTSSPVRPTDAEIERNPRARSARLRALRVRDADT